MQPARFVVNEGDAPANHGHNEDGHGDRARKQILDVLDIGIEFDNLQVDERIETRLSEKLNAVPAGRDSSPN